MPSPVNNKPELDLTRLFENDAARGMINGVGIRLIPSSAIVVAAIGILRNDATTSKKPNSHTGEERLDDL